MAQNSCCLSIEMLAQRVKVLKKELNDLESEIHRVIGSQANQIRELESLVNPYSDSGTAVCNFYQEDSETYG
jgi:hypothetical protein